MIWLLLKNVIAKQWNSIEPHGNKITLLSPSKYLQPQMWIVPETTLTRPNEKALLLSTPQFMDLPLELASNQLFQFLGTKYCVNYVLKMSWKWDTLYWSVSSTTPQSIQDKVSPLQFINHKHVLNGYFFIFTLKYNSHPHTLNWVGH